MLVTQSCLTLCDPVDCSPPGSSVHGILQARVLEWVAIFFSRGYSQARDQTQLSHTAGRLFNHWATREALAMQKNNYIFIPCPEDPRWASKMLAYSERCQIHDLWRRFNFRTRDQAWSLNNCKCYVLDNRDSKYVKEKLIIL